MAGRQETSRGRRAPSARAAVCIRLRCVSGFGVYPALVCILLRCGAVRRLSGRRQVPRRRGRVAWPEMRPEGNWISLRGESRHRQLELQRRALVLYSTCTITPTSPKLLFCFVNFLPGTQSCQEPETSTENSRSEVTLNHSPHTALLNSHLSSVLPYSPASPLMNRPTQSPIPN